MELIKEEAEKVNEAGVNGPSTDVYYEITPDMLKAGMEAKKQTSK